MEIEQGTCMRYLAKLVSGSNLLYNIKERKGGNQKKIDFPCCNGEDPETVRPQLSYHKQLLSEMASRLPKQRDTGGYLRTTSVVDYIYANYDIEEAKKELKDVSEKLAQVQLALDLANSTMSFDIPE